MNIVEDLFACIISTYLQAKKWIITFKSLITEIQGNGTDPLLKISQSEIKQ